jgi:hypothetical protein
MFCSGPEIVLDADGVTYVGSTPHRRDRPITHIAKVAQGAPFCQRNMRAHMCRSVLPDPAETPSFRRVVLCAPYGGNTDSLRF